MWQKHFRIAERQLLDGKHKTVEGHALKALQCAREANNLEQIAKTLSLLGNLYSDTEDDKAIQTLKESAVCAEKAFGPNSSQEASELEMLGHHLREVSDLTGCEQVWSRALAIREARTANVDLAGQADKQKVSMPTNGQTSQPDSYERGVMMHALLLDNFISFYLEAENFVEAEKYVLKAITLAKQVKGPVSDDVVSYVDCYIEVLNGLGRAEEAEELAPLVTTSQSCETGHSRADYLTQAAEILKWAEEKRDINDLASTIDVYRQAAKKMLAISEVAAKAVLHSDPFYELKQQAIFEPHLYLLTVVADLLHIKWCNEQDNKDLQEAAEILRGVCRTPYSSYDGTSLTNVLLDLSGVDEKYYAELDEHIAKLPESAATSYTRALSLYRRLGSCRESRQALKEALRINPHVPLAIVLPRDSEDLQESDSASAQAEEAGNYASADGRRQWTSDPGAIEFLLEESIGVAPGMSRRDLNKLQTQLAAAMRMS